MRARTVLVWCGFEVAVEFEEFGEEGEDEGEGDLGGLSVGCASVVVILVGAYQVEEEGDEEYSQHLLPHLRRDWRRGCHRVGCCC